MFHNEINYLEKKIISITFLGAQLTEIVWFRSIFILSRAFRALKDGCPQRFTF